MAERMLASSELIRGEHIGAVDVLLDEQLLVGGVPVQHDRVLEEFGDLARGARRAR